MSKRPEDPFESIESAREFIAILSDVITEAKLEVEEHLQQEAGSEQSRSLDALRIAHYNLVKLESHVCSSSRILNDLRSLRRLLFAERVPAIQPSAAKPLAAAAPEPVTPPLDTVVAARITPAPHKPVLTPAKAAVAVAAQGSR
jgi:hypothetical protein